MATPACQCFFTLLILIAASPLQIHARDSRFFSKVTRSEPETLSPKTQDISPSASVLPEAQTKTEQGYGLFGKEEAYVYAPTTTNPTKSQPQHYQTVEKQGMSDTRFLENGRYFYDINSDKEAEKLSEEDDGHESYYGQGYQTGNQYTDPRYQKQGMTDTRFYNPHAEKKSYNDEYSNNAEFYSATDKYRTGEKQGMSDTRFYNPDTEKKSYNDEYSNNAEFYGATDKYGSEEGKYRTGEKQGMSDTRFLENGKYFHDIQGESREDGNGVESYQGDSYDSNYEEEDEVSNGYKGKQGYEAPNKFPEHEFDSMEEYDKYEQWRSHQKYAAP